MNVVVYCGASSGVNPVYQEAAVTLGEWLVAKGHTLVYGGGKVGLMGTVADTVLAAGGEAIGIIPTFLKEREIAHPNLTALEVVQDMSERKKRMLDLAEICIALPGGPGTLEEIVEAVSWARVGQNDNPCIFYNVNNYYQGMRSFFDLMVAEGFLSLTDRTNVLFTDSLQKINWFIEEYQKTEIRKYS